MRKYEKFLICSFFSQKQPIFAMWNVIRYNYSYVSKKKFSSKVLFHIKQFIFYGENSSKSTEYDYRRCL